MDHQGLPIVINVSGKRKIYLNSTFKTALLHKVKGTTREQQHAIPIVKIKQAKTK